MPHIVTEIGKVVVIGILHVRRSDGARGCSRNRAPQLAYYYTLSKTAKV